MIDDSSSMLQMQQKLFAQLPLFIQSLESLPTPPNLHLAVVSSDRAPGDSTASIGCTTRGDQGQFQSAPRGTCTATTLAAGATFISDENNMPNFTNPLPDVLQCIALLGDNGCGFEHQLASIDRALGADGLGPAPSTNANFLRPNAYLVIVMLTNEDDCSAPTNTALYSLNGGLSNLSSSVRSPTTAAISLNTSAAIRARSSHRPSILPRTPRERRPPRRLISPTAPRTTPLACSHRSRSSSATSRR